MPQKLSDYAVDSDQAQGKPSLAELYEFVSQQNSRVKLLNDLSRARELIDAQLASGLTDQQTNERDQQRVRYGVDSGLEYGGPYLSTASNPTSAVYSIDGPLAAAATSAATSPYSDLSISNNEVNLNNAPINHWSRQYSDPNLLYRSSAQNSDQINAPTTNTRGFGRATGAADDYDPILAVETSPQVVKSSEDQMGADSLSLSSIAKPLVRRNEEKRRTSGGGNEHAIDDVSSQVKPTPKLTTLLEDDESINSTKATQSNELNATTQSDSPSFGYVITAKPTGQGAQESGSDDANGATRTGSTSIFKRMYTKLASYLPFLQQLSILNNPATVTPEQVSSGLNLPEKALNASESRLDSAKPSVGFEEGLAANASRTGLASSANTKQHFSDGTTDVHGTGLVGVEEKNRKRQSTPVLGEPQDAEESAFGSTITDKTEQSSNHIEDDERSQSSQDQSKVINNSDSDQEDNYSGIRLSKKQKQQLFNEELGDISEQTSDSTVKPQPTKVNLFRQSNLILPLDDDVVLQASIKKNPNNLAENFEGKYIYAPTQHYYLGNLAASTGGADRAPTQDESQIRRAFVAAPTLGYGRHFQPGDRIQNSYEPTVSELRNGVHEISSPAFGSESAYTQHKISSPLGLVDSVGPHRGSSSNDAYFVVMVGAFCVMAVAMVLSAGMFAYRIQQNRKSNTDTDYPTYGVVGPNNACAKLNGAAGKCGASSFVGGYFGGGSEPGSSRGSLYASKTGSAKHLPDLYGSDSGVDKSSLSAITGVAGNANKKGPSGGADGCQASAANAPANSQVANGSTASMAGFVANQDAARMYHYQHQKQQMIQTGDHRKCGALAGAGGVAAGRHASASDLDSDDENEDGSYTVYECPGLASAHEMEIKNPLFNDDRSP